VEKKNFFGGVGGGGGAEYYTYFIEESVIIRKILGVLFIFGKLVELLLLVFVGSDLVQNLNQIER
jgi:hypothetical protein